MESNPQVRATPHAISAGAFQKEDSPPHPTMIESTMEPQHASPIAETRESTATVDAKRDATQWRGTGAGDFCNAPGGV